MKYFFLIIIISGFFTTSAGGGSSVLPKEPSADTQSINERKNENKTIMQILPIVMDKHDKFIDGQLTKMAVRHITSLDRYKLAIGQINTDVIKHLPIENLEIKLVKDKNYRLELRIFELQRNTLVKKVVGENIDAPHLLQQSEKLFTELFISTLVK